MACLVLPVAILRSKCIGYRHGYRPLSDGEEAVFGGRENPVTVVVGKEKKEFLVDPFVLQENPFRALILETTKKKKNNNNNKNNKFADLERRRSAARGGTQKDHKVVFVDVDAILFEHMLWLMYNDCSSLFKLNVEEIVDFYDQDY